MAKKKVDVSENVEVIEEYQEVTAEPVAEVEPEAAAEPEPEAEAEAAEPEPEAEAEVVEPEPEAVIDEPDATDVTVVMPAPATQNVFVCYCSPQGLRFKVGGRDILINGAKVSDIVTQNGNAMRSGKFGVTELAREDWDAILAVHAKTKLFKSGRILAVNSMEDVKAVTVERNTLRHGREQVDPTVGGGVKKYEADGQGNG